MNNVLSLPTTTVSLPLETGTHLLSRDTVDLYFINRLPKKRCWKSAKVIPVDYTNGTWVITVSLYPDVTEFLYLKVLRDQVLLGCSEQSDTPALSLYAYYGLIGLMEGKDTLDLADYYWPDFFDSTSGETMLVTLTHRFGRAWVSVIEKDRKFIKPGQKIPYKLHQEAIMPLSPAAPKDHINVAARYPIGYCLADCALLPIRYSHFPYLVRYAGYWSVKLDRMSGFNKLITNSDDAFISSYTSAQDEINHFVRRMKTQAAIKFPDKSTSSMQRKAKKKQYSYQMHQMFSLWRQVVPLLAGQPFTHYFWSRGLNSVKGKPKKREMIPCRFATETPELCFTLFEYKECYELEMKIRVGNQLLSPHRTNPTFFVRSRQDPATLYLFNSLADYRVASFFFKYHNRIAMLKIHFEKYFKKYVDRLNEAYGPLVTYYELNL